MIHYHIGSRNPAAHYFDVTLEVARPDPQGQVLRLPAWIPGSYMIRDFARNIVEIDASCGQQPVLLTQLDKSTWQAEACSGELRIRYRVYAWDLSVRGAHLDTTHGFFNGTSVFLEVVGQSEHACEVTIERPEGKAFAGWRLATTLPRDDGRIDDFDFGRFHTENYLVLIDHPVEMGEFTRFDFAAGGIHHDVILTGRFDCDAERLTSDLAKICEHHIDLFGTSAPMDRYMFLVMVVGDGYGGLEHCDSTALMCSRKDLPQPGQSDMSDEYIGFLGLCSHEYFHCWNVKRIKPAVFNNPDLSTEVYTPLLWFFEGVTSYYDDLGLVRSSCIGDQQYLELLARTITRVQRNPGRRRQSIAESSFNAWSRFYKQDENAPNAIVSYYAKGSLAALCIDLTIRQLTDGEKSLDDVMRRLWAEFRIDGRGVDEAGLLQIINEVACSDISELLKRIVYGTEDLPLSELLATAAVTLSFRTSGGSQDKGGKELKDLPQAFFGANINAEADGLRLQSVVEDGSAQQAGLSAGDQIIAINGLRANAAGVQSWLRLSPPDSRHQVTAFRRDELMEFEVVLGTPEPDTAMLDMVDPNDPALRRWLHPDSAL